MIYKGQELEEWKPKHRACPYNNLSGQTIGKWYIICRSPNNTCSEIKYWCECINCKRIYGVFSSNLTNQKTKSCSKCCSKEVRQLYKCTLPIRYYTRIKKEALEKRNIPFTVSIDYLYNLFINQNKRCALSNREIGFYVKTIYNNTNNNVSYHLHTASLDRINSDKGYIEGNVQWVHKDINWMKQSFNQDYFIENCKLIAETHK